MSYLEVGNIFIYYICNTYIYIHIYIMAQDFDCSMPIT